MTPHRPSSPNRAAARLLPDRRPRSAGQSLVEFALILPLMLALVGVSLDFARVYQAWITLEGATRDAAEHVATTARTSAEAATEARRVVCLQAQSLPGFEAGGLGGTTTCSAPSVTVLGFELSTSAAGGSSRNPVGIATVQTSLPFRPLFAWPLITTDGVWTVRSTSSFSIIQGR
jgi:Flp pilus assembly protein TadG